MQRAAETFNAGDAAAVAALYTEDDVHEDIPAGVRMQGREEITAYVTEVFGQLDDFRFEPVFDRLEGDLAVLEYTLTGTHRAGAGGPTRLTGNASRKAMTRVLVVDDHPGLQGRMVAVLEDEGFVARATEPGGRPLRRCRASRLTCSLPTSRCR